MNAPATNLSEQLAARLLYLQQQKKAIGEEEAEVKAALENLHAAGKIPTKEDLDMLFSDGTFHRVRLQRQKAGTYFKVSDDAKEDYAADSHRLQARYLEDGRAQMAEKAATWRVQEVR